MLVAGALTRGRGLGLRTRSLLALSRQTSPEQLAELAGRMPPAKLARAMGGLLHAAALASDRVKERPVYLAVQHELLDAALRVLSVLRVRLMHGPKPTGRGELTELFDAARAGSTLAQRSIDAVDGPPPFSCTSWQQPKSAFSLSMTSFCTCIRTQGRQQQTFQNAVFMSVLISYTFDRVR